MRTRCPFGRRVLFCRENPLLENAFLCSRAQASVHLWAGESLGASADDRNRAARCTRRCRPHPPRFARHLPLKGKACGRPQGSPLHKKQTGSVGSAESGAAVEPHQHQFWECQGPVARREYRLPLRFCAPKLLQYFQVRVPRNGGPGVSGPMDLGGAKRSRSPSVASPGDPLVTFPSMGK